jgi:hypothetical protein
MNKMDTLQFPDSPMDKVCDGVHEALEEFVSREAQYIYSPNDRRKLFSLEDREDFVRNSDLSVDEYIQKHNLEYKWKRLKIQENLTYKQQKRFENSELTLDEYIENNNLYTATITESEKEMYILSDDEYEDDIVYSSDDNSGWGD